MKSNPQKNYVPRRGTFEKYKKAIDAMRVEKLFSKDEFCKKHQITAIIPYTMKKLGYLENERDMFMWLDSAPAKIDYDLILKTNNEVIRKSVAKQNQLPFESSSSEENAINLLKSLGYKIMKEVKQYEEI